MKKRLLSLLLAFCLIFELFVPVFALEEGTGSEVVNNGEVTSNVNNTEKKNDSDPNINASNFENENKALEEIEKIKKESEDQIKKEQAQLEEKQKELARANEKTQKDLLNKLDKELGKSEDSSQTRGTDKAVKDEPENKAALKMAPMTDDKLNKIEKSDVLEGLNNAVGNGASISYGGLKIEGDKILGLNEKGLEELKTNTALVIPTHNPTTNEPIESVTGFEKLGITSLSFDTSKGISENFTIEEHAFQGNELKSVNIPAKYIGDYAFADNNLEEVQFAGTDVNIGDNSFKDNKIVSLDLTNVSSVGNAAFANNMIEDIKFGNIKLIGDNAFSSNKLVKIEIPTGIEKFGKSVFTENNRYVEVVTGNKSIRTERVEGKFGHVVNPIRIKLVFYYTGEETYGTEQPLNKELIVGDDLSKDAFSIGDEVKYTPPKLNGYHIDAPITFTPDKDYYELKLVYQKLDKKPTLNLDNMKVFKLNEKLDKDNISQYIKAFDMLGKDISDKMAMNPEVVNTESSGFKTITITVTDDYGNKLQQEVSVPVEVDWTEYPIGEGYTLGDYRYNGEKVLGFTEEGLKKYIDLRDGVIIIPGYNPHSNPNATKLSDLTKVTEVAGYEGTDLQEYLDYQRNRIKNLIKEDPEEYTDYYVNKEKLLNKSTNFYDIAYVQSVFDNYASVSAILPDSINKLGNFLLFLSLNIASIKSFGNYSLRMVDMVFNDIVNPEMQPWIYTAYTGKENVYFGNVKYYNTSLSEEVVSNRVEEYTEIKLNSEDLVYKNGDTVYGLTKSGFDKVKNYTTFGYSDRSVELNHKLIYPDYTDKGEKIKHINPTTMNLGFDEVKLPEYLVDNGIKAYPYQYTRWEYTELVGDIGTVSEYNASPYGISALFGVDLQSKKYLYGSDIQSIGDCGENGTVSIMKSDDFDFSKLKYIGREANIMIPSSIINYNVRFDNSSVDYENYDKLVNKTIDVVDLSNAEYVGPRAMTFPSPLKIDKLIINDKFNFEGQPTVVVNWAGDINNLIVQNTDHFYYTAEYNPVNSITFNGDYSFIYAIRHPGIHAPVKFNGSVKRIYGFGFNDIDKYPDGIERWEEMPASLSGTTLPNTMKYVSANNRREVILYKDPNQSVEIGDPKSDIFINPRYFTVNFKTADTNDVFETKSFRLTERESQKIKYPEKFGYRHPGDKDEFEVKYSDYNEQNNTVNVVYEKYNTIESSDSYGISVTPGKKVTNPNGTNVIRVTLNTVDKDIPQGTKLNVVYPMDYLEFNINKGTVVRDFKDTNDGVEITLNQISKGSNVVIPFSLKQKPRVAPKDVEANIQVYLNVPNSDSLLKGVATFTINHKDLTYSYDYNKISYTEADSSGYTLDNATLNVYINNSDESSERHLDKIKYTVKLPEYTAKDESGGEVKRRASLPDNSKWKLTDDGESAYYVKSFVQPTTVFNERLILEFKNAKVNQTIPIETSVDATPHEQYFGEKNLLASYTKNFIFSKVSGNYTVTQSYLDVQTVNGAILDGTDMTKTPVEWTVSYPYDINNQDQEIDTTIKVSEGSYITSVQINSSNINNEVDCLIGDIWNTTNINNLNKILIENKISVIKIKNNKDMVRLTTLSEDSDTTNIKLEATAVGNIRKNVSYDRDVVSIQKWDDVITSINSDARDNAFLAGDKVTLKLNNTVDRDGSGLFFNAKLHNYESVLLLPKGIKIDKVTLGDSITRGRNGKYRIEEDYNSTSQTAIIFSADEFRMGNGDIGTVNLELNDNMTNGKNTFNLTTKFDKPVPYINGESSDTMDLDLALTEGLFRSTYVKKDIDKDWKSNLSVNPGDTFDIKYRILNRTRTPLNNIILDAPVKFDSININSVNGNGVDVKTGYMDSGIFKEDSNRIENIKLEFNDTLDYEGKIEIIAKASVAPEEDIQVSTFGKDNIFKFASNSNAFPEMLDSSTAVVTINAPKGRIEFNKIGTVFGDITKGDKYVPMQDREFTLYDSEGNVVSIVKSNKDGKVVFDDIKVAKYTVEETSLPKDEYPVSKTVSVKADDFKKVPDSEIRVATLGDYKNHKVYREPITVKVVGPDGKPIEGVTLSIQDVENKYEDTDTSSKSGVVVLKGKTSDGYKEGTKQLTIKDMGRYSLDNANVTGSEKSGAVLAGNKINFITQRGDDEDITLHINKVNVSVKGYYYEKVTDAPLNEIAKFGSRGELKYTDKEWFVQLPDSDPINIEQYINLEPYRRNPLVLPLDSTVKVWQSDTTKGYFYGKLNPNKYEFYIDGQGKLFDSKKNKKVFQQDYVILPVEFLDTVGALQVTTQTKDTLPEDLTLNIKIYKDGLIDTLYKEVQYKPADKNFLVDDIPLGKYKVKVDPVDGYIIKNGNIEALFSDTQKGNSFNKDRTHYTDIVEQKLNIIKIKDNVFKGEPILENIGEGQATEFLNKIKENPSDTHYIIQSTLGGIITSKDIADNPNIKLDGNSFSIYKAIGGVKYKLYEGKKEVEEITSDEYGRVDITTVLSVGKTYTLKEVETINGYHLNVDKVTFDPAIDFEFNQSNGEYNVVIDANPIKGKVVTSVYNVKDNKLLSGVGIDLYDQDNNKILSGVTDQLGLVEFNGLDLGSVYTVRESDDNTKYLNTKGEFKFKSGMKNIEDKDINNKEIFKQYTIYKDEIRSTINYNVVDINDKPLADVNYEVFDSNGRVIETGKTGEDGKIIVPNLYEGTYKVKVHPKDKYASTPGEITTVIELPKEFTDKTEQHSVDGGKFVIDKVKEYNITIINKDSDGKVITGNKFKLTNDSGDTIVDNIIVNEKGTYEIKGIPEGVYYIEQVSTIDGVDPIEKTEIQLKGKDKTVELVNKITTIPEDPTQKLTGEIEVVPNKPRDDIRIEEGSGNIRYYHDYSYKAKDKDNSDVKTTDLGNRNVEGELYNRHYLVGYPNKDFRPEGNMTRAEAAAMVYRLITGKTKADVKLTSAPYSDVNINAWYADEVAFIKENNIDFGASDNKFRPDEPITRAELAAMLVSQKNMKTWKVYDYQDIKETHWAHKYISKATDIGIMSGYEDGTIKPDQPITRSEVATLVNKYLNRVNDKVFMDKNIKDKYNDINRSHWAYYDVMNASTDHYVKTVNGKQIKWLRIAK